MTPPRADLLARLTARVEPWARQLDADAVIANVQFDKDLATARAKTLREAIAAITEWQRERDKWVANFNRSEQFQSGPTTRAEKAEAFLEREGYRRCDISACNCGSWHRHAPTPPPEGGHS